MKEKNFENIINQIIENSNLDLKSKKNLILQEYQNLNNNINQDILSICNANYETDYENIKKITDFQFFLMKLMGCIPINPLNHIVRFGDESTISIEKKIFKKVIDDSNNNGINLSSYNMQTSLKNFIFNLDINFQDNLKFQNISFIFRENLREKIVLLDLEKDGIKGNIIFTDLEKTLNYADNDFFLESIDYLENNYYFFILFSVRFYNILNYIFKSYYYYKYIYFNFLNYNYLILLKNVHIKIYFNIMIIFNLFKIYKNYKENFY